MTKIKNWYVAKGVDFNDLDYGFGRQAPYWLEALSGIVILLLIALVAGVGGWWFVWGVGNHKTGGEGIAVVGFLLTMGAAVPLAFAIPYVTLAFAAPVFWTISLVRKLRALHGAPS